MQPVEPYHPGCGVACGFWTGPVHCMQLTKLLWLALHTVWSQAHMLHVGLDWAHRPALCAESSG